MECFKNDDPAAGAADGINANLAAADDDDEELAHWKACVRDGTIGASNGSLSNRFNYERLRDPQPKADSEAVGRDRKVTQRFKLEWLKKKISAKIQE